MSVGLLALLDDVAAIAKVAAASLDDITGQALKAGSKAAGAVIDDAAVTPRYVDGFSADRELPIVGKIALGSIRNKLIFLLPAALLLSAFLPAVINPLLMIGGAYLCYEGAEKLYAMLTPGKAHALEQEIEPAATDAAMLETEKVAGAIKTDFILSAEIMTIALSTISTGNIITQALVLIIVAIAITAVVYGGVALIVKADDFGVFLARNAHTGAARGFGRWLVKIMPGFMQTLTVVGTAAMLWVGGGIIVHGLAGLGFDLPEHIIVAIADSVAGVLPGGYGAIHWITEAFFYGVLGVALGFLLIPLAHYAIMPVLGMFRREKAATH
ncbi:MAG TPA: DUF808 domain-containing protein [Pelagibacterium sp.]|uniref:DUF808 domain-containing protein n=1 Tax=Pelagibacterium sp. TaxID=1967288 RepID=UPI002CC99E7B|nr:DUF808 domain-containing protein [Pelagibacterium sp.]HWJ86522.1 DUF808 domain-containing protein [Pelagibacterium sp.]